MDRSILEKYFRQIYTLGEEIEIKKEKPTVYLYNGFHQYSKLDYINNLVKEKFEINYEQYDLYLRVYFDKEIIKDGYTLEIKSDKRIHLRASNRRGVRFGLEALSKVMEKRDGNTYIKIIKIEDYPSFNLRGIIEGFYGVPWTHEERLDSIEFLKEHRMNTYMYAPKDDLYHRDKWRELYPEEAINKLMELKEKCDNYSLDFWYCISPGKDFEYIKEEDFEFLYKKLDQVIGKGVNKFALLLDDIDYKLSPGNKNKFHRPGIAHSYICNKVGNYLKENVIELDFIMCPTEYATNFNTEYIDDLNNHLDKDIKIFWTGYNTVAEVISDFEAKEARDSFGHELLYWENYPVNDFQKHRLFLGPLVNRGKNIHKYGPGMVANPMNQWNLSKVPLVTISDYLWNSENYNAEESYKRAILEVAGAELKEELELFCKVNRKSVLDYYKFSELEKAIKNKDIEYIFIFYKEIETAIEKLKNHPNKAMLKEMEPWIISLENQMALLRAYRNNESIDSIAKICSEHNYTLGVPNVLNILKEFGETDLEYKEVYRENYWEF